MLLAVLNGHTHLDNHTRLDCFYLTVLDNAGEYELVGFVSHMGSNTACGHYVAHVLVDGRYVNRGKCLAAAQTCSCALMVYICALLPCQLSRRCSYTYINTFAGGSSTTTRRSPNQSTLPWTWDICICLRGWTYEHLLLNHGAGS
jgi:hypothetical protein